MAEAVLRNVECMIACLLSFEYACVVCVFVIVGDVVCRYLYGLALVSGPASEKCSGAGL